MPRRAKVPYVNTFVDRHGHRRSYFRRGDINISLPAIGTIAFGEAYAEALAKYGPEADKAKRGPAEHGTLAWVIEQYEASDHYKSRKPATQVKYSRTFDWLKANCGRFILNTMREEHVRKIRNALRDNKSVADAAVKKIGMLWRWAKEHTDLTLGPNPSTEVARLNKTHRAHPAWPDALCDAFEHLPYPKMVLAYYLLRYTGQRRSDVVSMEWSQFDGSAVEVVQQKTGTKVWIPCHPILIKVLAAQRRAGSHILMTDRGKPYEGKSLSTMFCTLCAELGFPGHSPHGLRHLAGAELAEAGCETREIMAILGHETEAQANDYTKTAKRKVLARSAVRKWTKGPEGL